MHFARSFVPMYSIFIPLQDTNSRMGATSACPGTHLCGTSDGLNEICDAIDFRVGDSRGRLAESKEDHIWKSGDAFLFNLNVHHRGPGHTDPNGKERVMLILTVSNRPTGPYFDKRQISLGTSYSLKWDMFGMTMKDLAVIETMLGFPRKVLRTMGIWKPKGNHKSHDVKWGWDYITVACSRIMNDQMGFRYEDLEVFVNKMSAFGPIVGYIFGYLPLEGQFDEERMTVETGWREYFRETSMRVIIVVGVIYAIACLVFFITSLLATGIKSTSRRFVKINATFGILLYGVFIYLSNTPWGHDILSGKAAEPLYSDKVPTRVTTVLPTKKDVLFSGRLHSPFLAGMNVIHDQQPGNAQFNYLLSQFSEAFPDNKNTLTDVQQHILSQISKEISDFGGRILKNDANGDWILTSQEGATNLIFEALVAKSNSIKEAISQELKFLLSECKHGRLRKTAMMKKHAMNSVEYMQRLLFAMKLPEKKKSASFTWNHRLYVPSLKTKSTNNTTKSNNHIDTTYEVKVGDFVEYLLEDEDAWFQGRVHSVKRTTKKVAIEFNDGDFMSNLSMSLVRPFKPYTPGDLILAGNMECIYTGVSAIGMAKCLLESGEIYSIDVDMISRPNV